MNPEQLAALLRMLADDRLVMEAQAARITELEAKADTVERVGG